MASDLRFFFVHVMKTGGATFRQHIYKNFAAGEVYPTHRVDTDPIHANVKLDYLLGLPEERRQRIRVYTGHFPYVATQLLGLELTTLTMLRDPVERTISYLKHCKRYEAQHRELALEEIYEDGFFFPTLIWNHQTKIFSMSQDDKLDSYLDVIEIDDRRLAAAKSNLERVDVLGLHERYGEFIQEISERYGWRFGAVANRRVGETIPVAESFRRRVADDNAFDMELYQFARRLYETRRRRVRA